ncbi:MAG: C4-type zinc ribbon domain-containing protein [Desulfovibrionales bacterium]
MYIEQIKKLVELQEIDTEKISLEKKLVEAPKYMEELQKKYDDVKNAKNDLTESVEMLRNQKKKLKEDAEEDANKIKKSKNKLMMVENSKEYHAMLREMDSMEKTNRLREEELSLLIEDLQNQESRLADMDQELKRLEEELIQQKETFKSEEKQIKDRIKVLAKQRENACAKVPAPILSRYNFIRDRLSNPVIVSVSEGICKGCNISIPPQDFIELQKGEQILSCPNCQRLIFWEEHFVN